MHRELTGHPSNINPSCLFVCLLAHMQPVSKPRESMINETRLLGWISLGTKFFFPGYGYLPVVPGGFFYFALSPLAVVHIGGFGRPGMFSDSPSEFVAPQPDGRVRRSRTAWLCAQLWPICRP
jgi:hypothetical protein